MSARPSGGGSGHRRPHDGRKHEPQTITLTDQHKRLKEKDKTGFICRMKFRNDIPDVPFEPKLLTHPDDPLNHLTQYKPTLLEKSHRWPLLTEPDLGIHIDLIEPEAYEPPASGAQMLPEDEALLKDIANAGKAYGPGGKVAKPNVPWLGRTIYYGNDDMYTYTMGSRNVPELPVPIQVEVKEKTAAEIVADANESFKAPRKALAELVHPFPSRKGMKAVASWELKPALSRWTNSYSEVVFEEDPVLDDPAMASKTAEHRAAVARAAVMHMVKQCPDPQQQRELDDMITLRDQIQEAVKELEEEDGDRGLSTEDSSKLLDKRNQLVAVKHVVRDLDELRETSFAYYIPAAGQKRRRTALQESGVEIEGAEAAGDEEMAEEGGGAATRMMCIREYSESVGRKQDNAKLWDDDHFVFSLTGSGKEGDGVAEINPLAGRTYVKRNLDVFTAHQMKAFGIEKIKQLIRRKGRRIPAHLEAKLTTRQLTDAETQEAQDKVKEVIEGNRDPEPEGEGEGEKEAEKDDDEPAEKEDEPPTPKSATANGAGASSAGGKGRAAKPSYDSSSSDSEAAPRTPRTPAAPTRASSSSSDD